MSYQPLDPFQTGMVPINQGASIYWEMSGNPNGKPALYLHGGPGSSLGSGNYRRRFDPEKYLVVGIDQRGCGRSLPLAADAPETLARNTTQALIADIEAVRRHLGIEKWLLCGSSWGVTLALAYGQAHPERVSEFVLVAVTTTSRAEVEWITEAMGRVFPEAWRRFEAASNRHDGERLIEAYARRLGSSDRPDRLAAARAWTEWESTHISLDPNWVPLDQRFDERQALGFSTLVTHYWANDGFLQGPNAILSRMPAIQHIPAALIHGRRDISGPLTTAWQLHQSWPASRLVVVESEGHSGPLSTEEARLALDSFSGNGAIA